MKANTPELIKFQKLQRRLGESKRGIAGLLELLWIATAKNCPCGDIGKFTNEDIAIMVDWGGDPDELVEALVACKWLDPCCENRLVIHDWEDHCPMYIRGNMAKSQIAFCVPKAPPKDSPKDSPKEPPSVGGDVPPRDGPTKPSLAKPLFGATPSTHTENPPVEFDSVVSPNGKSEPLAIPSRRVKKVNFEIPTITEVVQYCEGEKMTIDPENFWDTYQAQGWKLSNGQMMRDWKATCRKWNRGDKAKTVAMKQPTTKERLDRILKEQLGT